MKWLLVLLTSLIFRHIPVPTPAPAAIPTPLAVGSAPAIMLDTLPYTYAYIRVSTASAIMLIPNFSEKSDAKTIMAKNDCKEAINGGFYDTSNKPLGYFYTNGRTYGSQIPSNLVNGFFWADTNGGIALISSELPNSSMSRFALQSGPLLIFNGQILPLTIHSDDHARRMVVAKTTGSQYVFLSVYTKDAVFDGPLLADLPEAVTLISQRENFQIADALNLDGGSASAFYNGSTQLSELTPVGSIFCIQ